MSGNETIQHIKQALERGVQPNEARYLVRDILNLTWAADWSVLYRVLEVLSPQNIAQTMAALGLRSYETPRSWRTGRCVPKAGRFAEYARRLSALTGIDERIMHEARSRSVAKREGGLVPRPAWCVAYDGAGVLLYHYLRRLRDETGLTAAEAAGLVGVSEDDWEAWESGQRTPPRWKLRPLWNALGRSRGVLLCEMQAARDRGALAAYNERRRKARVLLGSRAALVAIEYAGHGGSLSSTARYIKELDEDNEDHRWDYERGCFEPDYLRRLLRDLREGRLDPQPITDVTTLRRFLEGQLRRPGQAIPLGGLRPEDDAEPEAREYTQEDFDQMDRQMKVEQASQRRRYEQLRKEQDEGLW